MKIERLKSRAVFAALAWAAATAAPAIVIASDDPPRPTFAAMEVKEAKTVPQVSPPDQNALSVRGEVVAPSAPPSVTFALSEAAPVARKPLDPADAADVWVIDTPPDEGISIYAPKDVRVIDRVVVRTKSNRYFYTAKLGATSDSEVEGYHLSPSSLKFASKEGTVSENGNFRLGKVDLTDVAVHGVGVEVTVDGSDLKKRVEFKPSFLDLNNLVLTPPPGRDGISGTPGESGRNGTAGASGNYGAPGADRGGSGQGGRGSNGTAGLNGTNGLPGRRGVDGKPGQKGADCPAAEVLVTKLDSKFFDHPLTKITINSANHMTLVAIIEWNQRLRIEAAGAAGGAGGSGSAGGNGGTGGAGGIGGPGGSGGTGGQGRAGSSGGPGSQGGLDQAGGDGDPGGQGDQGGDGGTGGNGGRGGKGGDAGNAADGGNGANGGPGGAGANLTVKFDGPNAFVEMIKANLDFNVVGGEGGKAGEAGEGGKPGEPGAGGKGGSAGQGGQGGSGGPGGAGGPGGGPGFAQTTSYIGTRSFTLTLPLPGGNAGSAGQPGPMGSKGQDGNEGDAGQDGRPPSRKIPKPAGQGNRE